MYLYHHHHHHHISLMELGHLLTRSSLTYPEVSSKVYHDSFCHMGNSVSLPWIIYFEGFYLYVVSIFSCIPAIYPKLVLFLTHLKFVRLFCNLSKCVLLFFSCISYLLLLFFQCPLLSQSKFRCHVIMILIPQQQIVCASPTFIKILVTLLGSNSHFIAKLAA